MSSCNLLIECIHFVLEINPLNLDIFLKLLNIKVKKCIKFMPGLLIELHMLSLTIIEIKIYALSFDIATHIY